MKNLRQVIENSNSILSLSVLLITLWPACLIAQDTMGVPVEPLAGLEQSEPIEQIQLLDATALETLVGPIALYPDDLVAIVLPAATYPLQIVQAARFLEALEQEPDLKPDEVWDDSVVALLNYPEAVRLLNDDLDWTLQLGNAVINQQDDVVAAIGQFRNRAYAAGNLKSDDKQSVAVAQGAIEITPVDPQVIYVPYYEPARVVVVQSAPVYYYYPDPYPLYYYPYPAYYSFNSGFFWGVTTAFSIGWHSHHLQVHYPYYPSHRYYNHVYYPRYYLRHHQSRKHRHDTHGSGFAGDYRGNRDHREGRRREGDIWQAGQRTSARPVRWANSKKPQHDQLRVANRSRSGEQISASYRKSVAEDRSLPRISTKQISAKEKGTSRTTLARTTKWSGRNQAAEGPVETNVTTNHDRDTGRNQPAVSTATPNKASRVTVVNSRLDRRREITRPRPVTGQPGAVSQGGKRQPPVTVVNARQPDNSNTALRNRLAQARSTNGSVGAGETLKPSATRQGSGYQPRPVQPPQVPSQARQSAAVGSEIARARSVQQQAPRQVTARVPVRAQVSDVKPVLARDNETSQAVSSSGRNNTQRSARNSSRSPR